MTTVHRPSTSVTVPPLRDYVAGDFREPEVGLGTWLENPNTGEPIQEQRASSEATVDAALGAAWDAHEGGVWSELEPAERAAALHRVADALSERAEECARAEALQTGVVISATAMLSFVFHAAFRLAAQQLATGFGRRNVPGAAGDIEVWRRPWGPALLLVPWNAPAPLAAHKMASALAAGAPVVVKPTEWAPAGTDLLADGAAEAGLAPGVVQIVHGGPEVGARIVADPRVRAVSLTGGLAAGRAIAAACALDLKPCQLELGGNNPVVVMPDADPDAVAGDIVALLTQLNGQWCRALGRLIVPTELAGDVLDAVSARFATIRMGDSLDPASEMGPIVHSRHLARLREQVAALQARGGTVHASTPLPDGPGNFLAPALVTGVAPEHTTDEIFGPVGVVHEYASLDEAVALANGTPFGLEGYVFGTDTGAALALARRVRAGEVKVNGSSVMSLDLMTPRPAWGLSGFCDEGTRETIEFFTGHQVVGVEAPAPGAAP